jgi:methyl-accepting chemotaxis protein
MKKFIALNLIGLTLVGILAVWLWNNARGASTTLATLESLADVRKESGEIRTQMIAMSDAMRGYLLNPSNRDEFSKKKQADRALSDAVERLLAETSDPTYADLAKKIGELDEQKLDRIEDRVLELAAQDPKAATTAYFSEYLPVRTEQMALVERLQALATTGMATEVKTADAGMARTRSLVTWLGAISVIAMGAAFAWSVRSTRRFERQLATEAATMFDAATTVLEAARGVSQSAQSLSHGATEQAASLQQTSASMEEMASVTRKNAEHSREAAGLMGDVDRRVQDSNLALGDMVTSMKALQDSSQQVARIIKTIDEIAFQTNLLALNAAVEAARAGDAGMGFAIVADEVRSLAQRSAQAAKDTEALIETSLAKTTAGNEKVEQVAAAIASITDRVTTMKGLVEAVSLATGQQARGIDQVAHAVTAMEKVTQMTAATAEESAASSEELHAKAEIALQVVERIELLLGRPREVQHAPAAHTTDRSVATGYSTARRAA